MYIYTYINKRNKILRQSAGLVWQLCIPGVDGKTRYYMWRRNSKKLEGYLFQSTFGRCSNLLQESMSMCFERKVCNQWILPVMTNGYVTQTIRLWHGVWIG